MSHITTVAVKILSLAALRAAAAELGGVFVEGKTSYNWYGRSVGDSPLPAGIKAEDLGKCAHAIQLPGVNYEVGVVALADGSYTLAFDFFGRQDSTASFKGHDGRKLEAAFGKGCQKLGQLYSVHAATLAARARGYQVRRQAGKGGAIQLVVSGGAM